MGKPNQLLPPAIAVQPNQLSAASAIAVPINQLLETLAESI
ncbi:unnamed protein product [Fructobacillus cardui]|nr:unnamed protein product [Fructobacillus cardui]